MNPSEFQKNMDRFFLKIHPAIREEVEADSLYQEAVKMLDVVKAQEIACVIMEGHGPTKPLARQDRDAISIERYLRIEGQKRRA